MCQHFEMALASCTLPRALASTSLAALLLASVPADAIEWTPTNAPASEPVPAGYDPWIYVVRLQDGRVLFVNVPFLVQAYDPVSGTWTMLQAPPTAIGARGHAVILTNGRVLFAGGGHGSGFGGAPGTDGSVRATQIFDPATNTWSGAGSLESKHDRGAALALPGGDVLVAGGHGNSGETFGTTSIFDGATAQWRTGPQMIQERWGQGAFVLSSGAVMMVGGTTPDTEVLASQFATAWQPGPALSSPADSLRLAPLRHGGQLLVRSSGGSAITETQRYDASSDGWVGAAALHVPRNGPQVQSLANGCVLVMGGVFQQWCDFGNCPPTGPTQSSELYDPLADVWAQTINEPSGVGSLVALGDGRVLGTQGWLLELGDPGEGCASSCECLHGICTDGACAAPPESESGCTTARDTASKRDCLWMLMISAMLLARRMNPRKR